MYLVYLFYNKYSETNEESFVDRPSVSNKRTVCKDISNKTGKVFPPCAKFEKKMQKSFNKLYNCNKISNKIDAFSSCNVAKNVKSTQVIQDLIESNSSLNPNFLDMKMHPQYVDVSNAFKHLVPNGKQVFNAANRPTTTTKISRTKVSSLIIDFMQKLNDTVKNKVRMPLDFGHKSGWESTQECLGLDSMYKGKLGKQNIKLLQVNDIIEYRIDDEARYTMYMVLQKNKARDQMIVRVSFVVNESGIQLENNFFSAEKVTVTSIIENVFVVGYLTKSQTGSFKNMEIAKIEDQYEDYDQLNQNKMFSKEQILDILKKKHVVRSKEMDYRNNLLDEEGQDFHSTLPNPYDFVTYKGTRTIFDDMDSNVTYY
jgi:hypothetical protein